MDVIDDLFFVFLDDIIIFCYVLTWLLTIMEVIIEVSVVENWDYWEAASVFIDTALRNHLVFIKFWFLYVFLKFFIATVNREKKGPWQRIYIPLHDSDDEEFQRFLRKVRSRAMRNMTYG